MISESCNLLTWDGVVEKLIGWRRDHPDSLNVEQPREVPNGDPGALQSLMNVSANEHLQCMRDDVEVGGPRSKLRDENVDVRLFHLLCFIPCTGNVKNNSSIPLHSGNNSLSSARIQTKAEG